jgi:hypothetical protein
VTVTLGGLTVLHCSHFPVTVSSIGATVIPGGAAPTTVPASVETVPIHHAFMRPILAPTNVSCRRFRRQRVGNPLGFQALTHPPGHP